MKLLEEKAQAAAEAAAVGHVPLAAMVRERSEHEEKKSASGSWSGQQVDDSEKAKKIIIKCQEKIEKHPDGTTILHRLDSKIRKLKLGIEEQAKLLRKSIPAEAYYFFDFEASPWMGAEAYRDGREIRGTRSPGELHPEPFQSHQVVHRDAQQRVALRVVQAD